MNRAPSPLPPTAPSSTNKKPGFTVVEAILSATVFALVATACLGVFFYGQNLARNAGKKMQAVFLAEEGLEAMRAIRNHTNALPDDGVYGLDTSAATWQLTENPDTPIEGFTRSLTVSTLDVTTKQIIVTIDWFSTANNPGSYSLTSDLTAWTAGIDNTP